jgi:hypothetical protein
MRAMHGDRPGGPIRWRMHLPSPPERVLAAPDSDEERAAFWAEEAVAAGGAIAFRFANGVRLTARILERRPPTCT